MPFGIAALAVAKGAPAVIRAGKKALAEWNSLPPEQKALVADQASAVMAASAALSNALGDKVGLGGPDSHELVERSLNPTPEFQVARDIVEKLKVSEAIATEELAAGLGFANAGDKVFKKGLAIAVADCYVSESMGFARLLAFPSADELASPEALGVATEMHAEIQAFGAVRIKQLETLTGCDTRLDPRFRMGVGRLEAEGSIAWSGPGIYSLPRGELEVFARKGTGAELPAAASIKVALASLSKSVTDLGKAVAAVKSGTYTPPPEVPG